MVARTRVQVVKAPHWAFIHLGGTGLGREDRAAVVVQSATHPSVLCQEPSCPGDKHLGSLGSLTPACRLLAPGPSSHRQARRH